MPHSADDSEVDRDAPSWTLIIVFHPDHAHEGRRAEVAAGDGVLLGREAASFGSGALDDSKLSREHANVRANTLDELHLDDQGSRNGSFVNGRRVTTKQLTDGDIISAGNLMLLVQRTRGGQTAAAALDSALTRLADSTATCLLAGEPGTGKDHLAMAVHERRGRTGSLIPIRCGTLTDELVPSELFGDENRPGLLEAAGDGSVYLDAVEDASELLRQSLLSFLDSREVRRIGATQTTHVDAHVIASTRLTPQRLGETVPAELAQRLQRVVVEVPPLRQRREDILPLARQFAEQFSGSPQPLHRKLRLALLRHSYPGNIRELQAIVENAVIDHDGDGPIGLSSDVAARLDAPATDVTCVSKMSAGTSFKIAATGEWFRLDGERTDLSKRRTLRRIVAALVQLRQRSPDTAMSLDDLLGAGWPGEEVIAEAGRIRVHVALTTLRKLGLRAVIVRRDEGYLLDSTVPIAVVDG